jgi:hypothetical protein
LGTVPAGFFWQPNIAMENGLIVDDLQIKNNNDNDGFQ